MKTDDKIDSRVVQLNYIMAKKRTVGQKKFGRDWVDFCRIWKKHSQREKMPL